MNIAATRQRVAPTLEVDWETMIKRVGLVGFVRMTMKADESEMALGGAERGCEGG